MSLNSSPKVCDGCVKYEEGAVDSYSTDFTKWDRFFISGWPALTLASPSLARAQARRDRRRIGCAQRMKWA